eukprot:1586479-Pyramimonas_sp.AAC.1
MNLRALQLVPPCTVADLMAWVRGSRLVHASFAVSIFYDRLAAPGETGPRLGAAAAFNGSPLRAQE